MILTIDMAIPISSSAVLMKNRPTLKSRITTIHSRTSTEYALLIKDILDLHGIDKSQIEGSIVSSVVPPLNAPIQSALKKILGKRPLMVGSGMKTGLNIIMDNPKTVGSDQIVDAVAALKEYPCPIIVIDMGTATTMSVIDKNGNYIGGVILPGLKVSLDSLSSNAAQLPFISLEIPGKVIGKNTIDCMRSGILYGKCRPDGRHHRSNGRRAGGNRFCSCHWRPLPLCYPSVPS